MSRRPVLGVMTPRTPVHRTCRNASCRRYATDAWPSLRTCPGCGQPLTRRELP